jgi:hypothetical protein
MAIDDATFREIVRRNLDVDPVAWKYSDSMPAHTPGDVGEDRVTVFELYGKGRTRKDLLDAADRLDRTLLGELRGRARFGLAANGLFDSVADSY